MFRENLLDLRHPHSAHENHLVPARCPPNYFDVGFSDTEKFRQKTPDFGVRLSIHGRRGDFQPDGILPVHTLDSRAFRSRRDAKGDDNPIIGGAKRGVHDRLLAEATRRWMSCLPPSSKKADERSVLTS